MTRVLPVLFFVVLNLAAQEGHRASDLRAPGSAKTFLTRLPPADTGIQAGYFVSEEKQLENSLLGDGAGLTAGDFDADGLCDLYVCGGERPNALFRNLGNWKFQNVTTNAGLQSASLFSTGAAFEDMDGDRDLDLLINKLG